MELRELWHLRIFFLLRFFSLFFFCMKSLVLGVYEDQSINQSTYVLLHILGGFHSGLCLYDEIHASHCLSECFLDHWL